VGFKSASGECVDGQGNVYVTNIKPLALYEYAHGSKNRIATYLTKHAGSEQCTVSANTDIAVIGAGNYINIFKPGKKSPVVLRDPRSLSIILARTIQAATSSSEA
jgi:hypothetical protein